MTWKPETDGGGVGGVGGGRGGGGVGNILMSQAAKSIGS